MKGLFPHFDLKPWHEIALRAVEALESIAEELEAIRKLMRDR